eukprot:GHVU01036822.1.p1 GENE.GHVU01036822.1~~GHVU01036822.1.p1  ORF type:complete len:380 (-),score=59.48 GHVU01036822.1:302-1441(-)
MRTAATGTPLAQARPTGSPPFEGCASDCGLPPPSAVSSAHVGAASQLRSQQVRLASSQEEAAATTKSTAGGLVSGTGGISLPSSSPRPPPHSLSVAAASRPGSVARPVGHRLQAEEDPVAAASSSRVGGGSGSMAAGSSGRSAGAAVDAGLPQQCCCPGKDGGGGGEQQIVRVHTTISIHSATVTLTRWALTSSSSSRGRSATVCGGGGGAGSMSCTTLRIKDTRVALTLATRGDHLGGRDSSPLTVAAGDQRLLVAAVTMTVRRVTLCDPASKLQLRLSGPRPDRQSSCHTQTDGDGETMMTNAQSSSELEAVGGLLHEDFANYSAATGDLWCADAASRSEHSSSRRCRRPPDLRRAHCAAAGPGGGRGDYEDDDDDE